VLTTSPATSAVRLRVERRERFAGVDGDPQLESVGLVPGPVADCQRRPHRPFWVVFVRYGRSEHGHHRVADELLDRPAEVLELLPNACVVRAEQADDVFGIHLLGARGEADQVGEEDGDDLALLARCCHGLSLGGQRPAASAG